MIRKSLRVMATFLVLGAVSFSGVTAWAQPEIVFTKRSHNFGTSFPHQDLNFRFEFTNKGDKPLFITKVQKSCGCTAAVASATTILPSATGVISVTLTTSSPGKKSQSATIFSNDPKNGEARLEVLTTVRDLWTIKPKSVMSFKDVLIGATSTQTVFLSNADGDKFEIKSANIKKPNFKVSVGEMTSQGMPITVIFKGESKKGILHDVVEIKTDHPQQPIIRMSVIGRTSGYITFSHPRAFFRNVKVGKVGTLEILARLPLNFDVDDLVLTEIKSADGKVVGEVLGKRPDGQLRIRLTFTSTPKMGYQSGNIYMKTNLKQEPLASLQYSALVTADRR